MFRIIFAPTCGIYTGNGEILIVGFVLAATTEAVGRAFEHVR